MTKQLVALTFLALLASPSMAQVIDQQHGNSGTRVDVPIGANGLVCQTVTVGRSGTLSRVDLRVGGTIYTGSGDVQVRIVPLSGGGAPRLPLSGVVATATAPVNFGGWTSFDLSGAAHAMTAGERFAIVVNTTGTLFTYVGSSNPGTYADGIAYETQTNPFTGVQSWSAGDDLLFRTWVENPPLSAPLMETFDAETVGTADCLPSGSGSLPSGWSQNGTSSWTVWSGGTPSLFSGPPNAFGGQGNFVYTSGSGACSGGEFILVSPLVDTSALTRPAVSMQLHRFGYQLGTLVIEETDGSGGWTELGRVDGDLGLGWVFGEFRLTRTISQVRFRVFGGTGAASEQALDSIAFGEWNGVGAQLLRPRGPFFQPNSPASTLTVSNTQPLLGTFTQVEWTTNLVGMPHEIMANFGLPVSRENGGFETPGLQTINVPLDFATLVFLNQSTFGSMIPHPGRVSANVYAGSPLQACAQQYVADPSSIDGVTFSEAIGIEITPGNPGPHTLRIFDDDTERVRFTDSPTRVGLGIPFMGTVFTEVYVNSNGNVTFEAGDVQYTPSMTSLLNGRPRFGLWTDLNPTQGGAVTYTADLTGMTIQFSGVPFFGESVAADFSMTLGADGSLAIDVSAFGVNPMSQPDAGDAIWLGVTGGATFGATDGGPTAFASGASGSGAGPTDMIYSIASSNDLLQASVPGQLDAITALKNGAGRLVFTPLAGGLGYSWAGF